MVNGRLRCLFVCTYRLGLSTPLGRLSNVVVHAQVQVIKNEFFQPSSFAPPSPTSAGRRPPVCAAPSPPAWSANPGRRSRPRWAGWRVASYWPEGAPISHACSFLNLAGIRCRYARRRMRQCGVKCAELCSLPPIRYQMCTSHPTLGSPPASLRFRND